VKKARSPEARALPGLWSVWADAHGVDLEVEFEFEVEFKIRPLRHGSGKKSFVTTLCMKCSAM